LREVSFVKSIEEEPVVTDPSGNRSRPTLG